MGFSEWYHLDFKVIQAETKANFFVVSEQGGLLVIPKKQVAYPEDYQAGDKNGTISIKESFAKSIRLPTGE